MFQANFLRIGLIVFVIQCCFLNSAYCQTKKDSTYKKASKRSLANTTWSGVDSDGDFYEFRFLENGNVSYRTNTSRSDTVQFNDEEDVWFQHGSAVILSLGNASVYKGIISNNKMEGAAWNDAGRRWTWVVKKK